MFLSNQDYIDRNAVEAAYPAAAEISDVEGGWMVFDTVADAEKYRAIPHHCICIGHRVEPVRPYEFVLRVPFNCDEEDMVTRAAVMTEEEYAVVSAVISRLQQVPPDQEHLYLYDDSTRLTPCVREVTIGPAPNFVESPGHRTVGIVHIAGNAIPATVGTANLVKKY